MRNFALGFAMALLGFGCTKSSPPIDTTWSFPQDFSQGDSGLARGLSLYRLNGTLVAQKGETCFFFDGAQSVWNKKSISGLGSLTAVDPNGNGVVFVGGNISGKTLTLDFSVGMLDPQIGLKILKGCSLVSDQSELFPDLRTNQMLRLPNRNPEPVFLDRGMIESSNVFVPYCVHGETIVERSVRYGPYDNGVFVSSDFGGS